MYGSKFVASLIAGQAAKDAAESGARDAATDVTTAGEAGLFRRLLDRFPLFRSFGSSASEAAGPLPVAPVSGFASWEEYQDEVAKTISGLHDDLNAPGSAGEPS
jgi:hypothetical protein